MPATMPSQFVRTTIRTMKLNDRGFVPAAALHVDEKGEAWLLGDAVIQHAVGGIVDPVRVILDDDGYRVEMLQCRAQWDRSPLTVRHFVSNLVPVSHIHG